VFDGGSGRFEFRFQPAIDEGSDMPFDVVAEETNVPEDLAFLPHLPNSSVSEAFG